MGEAAAAARFRTLEVEPFPDKGARVVGAHTPGGRQVPREPDESRRTVHAFHRKMPANQRMSSRDRWSDCESIHGSIASKFYV
jgi:hypothetical protein